MREIKIYNNSIAHIKWIELFGFLFVLLVCQFKQSLFKLKSNYIINNQFQKLKTIKVISMNLET